MEGIGLNAIPKFKSTEEELTYLRAQVRQREEELERMGTPASQETVASATLKAYQELPADRVLHPSQAMSAKEVEAVVLRLAPEPHDAKMEELLGVLLDKGIKNAMSVIDRMDNPHLDDDFHRFLVQYLNSTHKIPGLKEATPLWKALSMVLFEITLPEVTDDKKKGLKELLSMMEQFYAGMHSVGEGRENPNRNHFTLEIALSNVSDQFIFYAAVPKHKAELFEKLLLGIHADAKAHEVTDDYNIFGDTGAAAVGSYARLSEYEVFPIKTYDAIDHDPLNLILNTFTKLKKEGEGAAIQFSICPEDDDLIKEFHMMLEDVKNGDSVRTARSLFRKFNKEFAKIGSQMLFGASNHDKEKKVNDRAVEYITEKIKSTIMAVNIRVITSAETKERANAILSDIESSFNQFTEAHRNGFIFERPTGSSLKELFHDFSYRMFSDDYGMPLNLKELATIFHFPHGISSSPQLKQARANIAPAPIEMMSGDGGLLLGVNNYRGASKKIFMEREDRMRHFYVIGQTGTGKTTLLKNMIVQDIKNGEGVCFIDPHGSDIQDILAQIPPERADDVIYFDPAYIPRPMGLNMLEYDERFPEQKTFVVNELIAIFNKLFDMKVAGGPAFEQYFRNSALLVMEHPESGSTLLEIGRVLADKAFRDMKLSHCKNPIITQFWANAERTTGEQSLANFVPYITNKFDVFVSNDIMRPIISQQHSVFNFRKVMDEKKILLVNLSKGRLGDINANLIGLILVGKISMAALSRVDVIGTGVKPNDFYLYIDEFQNVTTDSIATILSEARKYRLSLNVAHQYIAQLADTIKNAVFGNVGSMAVFRVGPDDAAFLEKQFEPVFKATDIMKLDNRNAYIKMLIKGTPTKPFNIETLAPEAGNPAITDKIKQLSYLKFGRDRAEVEEEIMERYRVSP